jgi:hypothetical protein
MKFFLASILAREGMSRRTVGRETNELLAMLSTSSWLHELISFGSVEIRLLDRSSSEKKRNVRVIMCVYKRSFQLKYFVHQEHFCWLAKDKGINEV